MDWESMTASAIALDKCLRVFMDHDMAERGSEP